MIWSAERLAQLDAIQRRVMEDYRRAQAAEEVPRFVQPPSGGGGTTRIVRMARIVSFTTGYTGFFQSGFKADILSNAGGAVESANVDVYVRSYDGINPQNDDKIGQQDLTKILRPMKQGWRVLVERLTLPMAVGEQWWMVQDVYRGGCSA